MSQSDLLYINASVCPGASEGVFGNIDFVDETGITGWIADLADPASPCDLNGYVRGRLVASGLKTVERPDIAALAAGAARGFHLSWHIAGFEEEYDEEDYPLLFKFHGKNIAFDSYPRIAADKLLAIARARVALEPFTARRVRDAFQHVLGSPAPQTDGDVRLIAYYLPQFHPVPENDEWWGAGFSEWTNVVTARSYFKDHCQPQIPGALGFYDLRLAETRQLQADLARQFGIYGFCYYYYWFNGRKILEQPLEGVLRMGKPDFPFCICWANESWSRRWDGSEQEILIRQEHTPESDAGFMESIIPILKDPRYIQASGAPLLLVYRATMLPDARATAERWRQICKKHGIDRIHLCACETFDLQSPYDLGFDSAAEFPPHRACSRLINNEIADLPPDYTGNIYDYEEVVRHEITRTRPHYKVFPALMTSWDNTPRRGKAGNIFFGSSPGLYEVWLRGAIGIARDNLPKGERFVFINAWNEWAESAHLEPDKKNGFEYLEATLRAVSGGGDWRALLEYARALPALEGAAKETFLARISAELEKKTLENQWYEQLYGQEGMPKSWSRMKPGAPLAATGPVMRQGQMCLDQINHVTGPELVEADKNQKLYCVGWAYAQDRRHEAETPSWLVLLDQDCGEIRYHGFIPQRLDRPDLAGIFHMAGNGLFAGFRHVFDLAQVKSGIYAIGFLSLHGGQAALLNSATRLEVS